MKNPTVTKGFKGFDASFKCRAGQPGETQYAVGETFNMPEGKTLKACPESEDEGGLHFCENPMDVLGYYPPNTGRYAEVDGHGEAARKGDDSKVAVSKLYISAEITLGALLGAGVKFILSKVDFKDAPTTNTGDRSAATNTGYRSAATNTGYQSAATNTGYQSAATVEGAQSVAVNMGIEGKAKGAKGCWLVLAEWTNVNFDWHRTDVRSFAVDGDTVKADTFYTLRGGVLTEA